MNDESLRVHVDVRLIVGAAVDALAATVTASTHMEGVLATVGEFVVCIEGAQQHRVFAF